MKKLSFENQVLQVPGFTTVLVERNGRKGVEYSDCGVTVWRIEMIGPYTGFQLFHRNRNGDDFHPQLFGLTIKELLRHIKWHEQAYPRMPGTVKPASHKRYFVGNGPFNRWNTPLWELNPEREE